jgi:hypothetical protein
MPRGFLNSRLGTLLLLATTIAKEEHDGHLTIMKFSTNWRVGFGTPCAKDEIQLLAEGKTMEEALSKAIFEQKTWYGVFEK